MKRVVLVALACTGCEAVLGLGETTYTPDATPDVAVDSCGSPTCQTFSSCSALRAKFPTAENGVYMLNAGTGPFSAYCEMVADGGGWTLALKVDGRTQTFRYDQAIWTDATLHRSDAPNYDQTEAKLETFNAVSFTELRVGLEYPIGSGTTRWAILPVSVTSGARLRDLFASTTPIATTLGRTVWKGLIGPAASLQLECNQEGINVGNMYSRVRIGIVGNNEVDCVTPDSRIGIGGADNVQCTFATASSAGNSACYLPDNGEVELVAFGYVFVR